MAFTPSPAFGGRSTTAILDSSRNDNLSDSIEDDDGLSIVSQSPYFTQPTQIVERTTLKPAATSTASSPRSIIEVPASSPFKPQSALRTGGRLASAMAPAGTLFRAPPKQPARKIAAVECGSKRSIDVIMISDDELDTPTYRKFDSSGDERPIRGDIKPSSFRPKEPKSVANLAGAKSRPSETVSKKSTNSGSPLTSPTKEYVSLMDWASSDSDSDSLPKLSSLTKPLAKPAPAPQEPPRRRLMQGRRVRQPSPASSPVKLAQTTLDTVVSRPKKPVVVLSDSDDSGDEYKKEKKSPETEDSPQMVAEELAFNDRVLRYLNTCNTIQLIAIANVKEESARLMLTHQPFSNIEAARSVTISQKKQRKKSARVAIGEEVVSAVKAYVRALDGIDHVMAVCDSQAESIKSSTSRWIVDTTGQPRNDARSDDEKPLTPRSMGETSKLVDLPVGQPKLMDGHCTMKSFQVYGLNWLFLLYQKNHGAILADDMGLGKTCQVISLICTIVEDWNRNGKAQAKSHAWPNLIVVPPSTLANWKAEFKRFAPELNVTLYQGSQAVRDEIANDILDDPSSHHVILTSYTQVSRPEDISNMRKFQPNAAIFDEGHKMKNPKTKLYKDLIRITAAWRLILSGTPVQNNLMEMISLLQFIEPELFRDHYDDLEALFSQKVSLTAVSQGALLYGERVARARSILEPFILQRRKEQVLKDLPPKTAKVVYCEMDEKQASIYNDYERRFRKADASQTTAVEKIGRDNDNNNVWIQLRKSAIHPQLFRRFFTDKKVEKIAQTLMKRVPQSELRQPNITHLTSEIKALSDFEIHLWCRDYKCIREYDLPDGSWMESAKVQSLLKLIAEYRANGDRALVFTRYAKVIELLGESLASEGIEYLSLQGNTDVSERQELINQFNSDSSIPVFLLTTGSGGTGINLTAANKVIIFDQSDNPQDDVQAENRAHRLGQTKPVEVIRLISKGTIEELVYKACQKKLELANKVTGWAAVEMSAGDMEAAVRKELLKGNGISTPPNESARNRS